MEIRQATTDDVDAAMALYAAAPRRALCPAPTRARTLHAIAAGELFVLCAQDGLAETGLAGAVPVGAVTLNRAQPAEYARVAWSVAAKPGRALVVHTLCVAPTWQRCGCGAALMRFALARARELDCTAVRLDTWGSNAPACALYEKLGFTCAGTVPTIVDGRPDKQLFFERETSQNGTVGTVPTVPPRPSDATSWPPMQHQH